jgi:Family of unknown function (DUF5906)
MNLFRGFGVQPRQGDCWLIKQHILEVICEGNEIINDAMLNLIAWQLQNVGKQSRIIVVLISEKQQTGKGSLLDDILCRIWGDAGFSTMELSDVLGDFNDVLRGKGYVFLDEALFAGDRRAADKVKGLCARPMLQLNKKFVPLVTVPNGVNLWISSNHETPVYVEEHDKRYWPMRIWEGRRDDHDYWLALHREIDNGGLEAFLWEMLNRDVGNFIPQRDVPHKTTVWHEARQHQPWRPAQVDRRMPVHKAPDVRLQPRRQGYL